MNLKKAVSFLMSVILMLSVLAGCGKPEKSDELRLDTGVDNYGNNSGAKEKILDPATVRIMIPGIRPPAMEDVQIEAEKRMAGSLNIKLDIVFVPWEQYRQRTQVTLNVGENFDLMLDAPWNNMQEMISAGYYEPLDELIRKYGPNILNTRPEEMWKYNKFQGKDGLYRIYGVPLGNSHFMGKSYIIRQDIREKLGMKPITTWDDLIKYLYAVKKRENGIVPFLSDTIKMTFAEFKLYMDQETNIRPLTAGLYGPLYFKGNDAVVYNMFEKIEPEFWNAVMEARKLYNDGIIGADVMATSDYGEQLRNGKVACVPHFSFEGGLALNEELEDKLPGAKFENVILLDPGKHMISDFKQWNFQCIPVVSKNKERAVMFLNWANEKENFDLLSYGIKGVHWEAVGDKKIRHIFNPERRYEWFPYLWTLNPVHCRLDVAYPPEVERMELWIRNASNFIPDKISGFTFNVDPVNNEMSQYNNLRDTYWYIISSGTVDPDKTWQEYKEKCAPYAKRIQEEMQRQINEFLK